MAQLSSAAFRDLAAQVHGRVLRDEPLARHTSIKTGGPAEALVVPKVEEDVSSILQFASRNSISINILGNGTNLVVSDAGVPGIVLKIVRQPPHVKIEGDRIHAGAGVLMPTLATMAADRGLAGLEFAIGIPGALGGGIFMNAGTRQGEIKDVLETVTWCDLSGQVRTSKSSDLQFAYRSSSFQGGGQVILGATLKLKPEEAEPVRQRMNEYLQYRRKTQPLTQPNMGSVFSNPPGDFAGRLIEAAGLKGHRVGGAQVSTMHANFIVNAGGATSDDVVRLMREICDTVQKKFGVALHPEVRFLGMPGLLTA